MRVLPIGSPLHAGAGRWSLLACGLSLFSGCSSPPDMSAAEAGAPRDLATVALDSALDAASSCSDGLIDGDETDVDCGGPVCPACQLGMTCVLPRDCASRDCVENSCIDGGEMSVPVDFGAAPDLFAPDLAVARACLDGVKDGMETDIDCGGSQCPKCAGGKACIRPLDCASGTCTAGRCVAAPLTLAFAAAATYPTGTLPSSVKAGDLNGDGKPDLVVLDNLKDVMVFLGGNGGVFKKGVAFSAANSPLAIALGDLTGDKILDLVAVNGASGVSVLVGVGDGSFQAPLTTNGLMQPMSSAIGDFNGDGKLDLAVANAAQPNAALILLGNGNGTFQNPVAYPTDQSPSFWVGAADLDGDGRLDLAVANYAGQGSVSILIGKGDGTFQPAVNYPSVRSAPRGAFGDFNGDGKPDLALADTDEMGAGISLLINAGNGTFQAVKTVSATAGSGSVAVADFDLDGNLDVVAADNSHGPVFVYRGDGKGNLDLPVSFATPAGSSDVAAGDLNGDGLPDIAVANSTANLLSILINTSH